MRALAPSRSEPYGFVMFGQGTRKCGCAGSSRGSEVEPEETAMVMPQSFVAQQKPNNGLANPTIPPEIRALEARVADATQWVAPLKRQMATVIVGQQGLVDRLVLALLTN